MVDETFPNLHIHVRRLSHTAPYLQQVEATDKYIMTHHLTTPTSRPKLQ